MKVEVLTVEQVRIKQWRWWSNWIDICTFSYGHTGYLLQMRISRTNAKQFAHRRMLSRVGVAEVNAHEAGDLTQMGSRTQTTGGSHNG